MILSTALSEEDFTVAQETPFPRLGLANEPGEGPHCPPDLGHTSVLNSLHDLPHHRLRAQQPRYPGESTRYGAPAALTVVLHLQVILPISQIQKLRAGGFSSLT